MTDLIAVPGCPLAAIEAPGAGSCSTWAFTVNVGNVERLPERLDDTPNPRTVFPVRERPIAELGTPIKSVI